MQYRPVTLGLLICECESSCGVFPPKFFIAFPFFSVLAMLRGALLLHFYLLHCVDFRQQGAISPHNVRFYDVFAIYNENQCRMRSISCATYKVIVPSGPHLAKCRLSQATFSVPAKLVAAKHSSKNSTLQSYSKLLCICLVRISPICWAYHVAFIKVPNLCLHTGIKLKSLQHLSTVFTFLFCLIAATHRLGCGRQKHQVCPSRRGGRHHLRHQRADGRHPRHEEAGPRREGRVHPNSPGR